MYKDLPSLILHKKRRKRIMSKNYLELKSYFPELFEKTESSFNPVPSEIEEDFDANLQFKPGFEEEEQTI
jgi:hypothetical protein